MWFRQVKAPNRDELTRLTRTIAHRVGRYVGRQCLVEGESLVRYGLLARNLIAYEPVAQEVSDLRSLLNRLDVLERQLAADKTKMCALGAAMRKLVQICWG